MTEVLLKTNVENNNEQKEGIKVSFSSVLDLIEKNITENKEKNGTERIIEPFEARIEKESITISDLKRMTNLPIEIFLMHDKSGDLIVSTGSRGSTQADYGNEYREEIRKARELAMSGKKSGNFSEDEKLLIKKLMNHLDASEISHERTKNEQDYTAHQHPTSDSKPSIEDIVVFSLSKSKIHFILSKEGVSICHAGTNQADRAVKFATESKGPIYGNLGYDEFINSLKVVKHFVKFEDPEFLIVLQMFKGEADIFAMDRLSKVKELLK